MKKDTNRHLQELERRKEVAEGLSGILAVLNSNQSLDVILEYVTNCAAKLLRADAAAIYRLRPETHSLTIQSSYGLTPEYIAKATISLGTAATGQAVQESQPVTIIDIKEAMKNPSLAFDQEIIPLLNTLSQQYGAVLAVPLIIKEKTTGSLTLYYTHSREFSQEDIDLAVAFCDQVALAIENARLHEKIQEEAVAAERNRIARDLHDSVTQTIFSASLIAEVLPTVWHRDLDEGEKALEELRQLTRSALAEMRTLLLELRPAELAETPLDDLLQKLGESVAGRLRNQVQMNLQPDVHLPLEVKLAFYRIAQEALNNLTKHSGADQVTITLTAVPSPPEYPTNGQPAYVQSATLQIQDNGCGFNPDAISSEHLGVGIMQERAANSQSRLSINSHTGRGTEITLAWPN